MTFDEVHNAQFLNSLLHISYTHDLKSFALCQQHQEHFASFLSFTTFPSRLLPTRDRSQQIKLRDVASMDAAAFANITAMRNILLSHSRGSATSLQRFWGLGRENFYNPLSRPEFPSLLGRRLI